MCQPTVCAWVHMGACAWAWWWGLRGAGVKRGLQGRCSAAQIMCTRVRGGVVYVAPGCFAHPGGRAFWLGGVCKGRRAQGQ